MKMTLIVVFILLFSCESTGKKVQSGLDFLFNKIFIEEEYSNMVRPYGANDLTAISTELKLLQIDLDEKYQELISTVWVEMSWYDDRLSWNPDDFGGLKEITMSVEKIWYPDIVLQNGVGQNDYLNEFKLFNPWILHTGLVTWVPEVRLHTKCVIKVKDFPFDTQCCEINFYSWAHTASQMKISQFDNKNTTNITHLTYNTEWFIYNTCALNTTIKTSQDLEWWITSYVLRIKRESIYHIYTLIMPCGVLSALSALLFWLPPDSDEKITLGVTILLAFFVNSLVVSNYTPEAAADLPVIGVYYTFNIFMVAASLTCSVLILKLHFRGHQINRAPYWLKKILFLNNLPVPILLKDIRSNCKSHRKHTDTITPPVEYTSTFKILKILKIYFKKIDEENLRKNHIDEIIIEWKEIARRLEYVFLVLNSLTITIVPLILFGKYVIQDETNQNFNKCGCEYSFIKNI